MGRSLIGLMASLVGLAAAAGLPPDTIHVLQPPPAWQYAPTASPPDIKALPDAWSRVALPHHQGTEACGAYRVRVPVPGVWAQRRVTLVVRAEGAAWAWVNGEPLGARPRTALDVRLDASKTVRPGLANDLVVAVAAGGTLERGGLTACWLEATGGVTADRLRVAAWPLADSALVDVHVAVGNHTEEVFDGRLELALEPAVRQPRHHPVWRWGSNLRLDPGRSAAVYHAYEIEGPRLWRPDDPFLYRLTATVKPRDSEPVFATERLVGVRSVRVAEARWHVNDGWVRLGGLALRGPGATLLCPQAGQASDLAARLAPGRGAALADLLVFCDGRGIVALLEAPELDASAPGRDAALDGLAALALAHPCVWGWIVDGALEARETTVSALRRRTPRLPVGCPAPDFAEDAEPFDFVVSRYKTRAVRHDNDGYGRRLEDLKRDLGHLPIVCIDRIEPAEPGDLKSVADSLKRRRGEAARRFPIAMVFFQTEPDERVFRIIEEGLRSKQLKPPHHNVRLDKDAFVVKSRFEGHIASPVAQRMPCSPMVGYRLVWRAARGSEQAAGGAAELPTIRPRPLERHAPPPIRQEVEWRTKEAGELDFIVELQSAAGQIVAAHRNTLILRKKKDGKPELKVGPPRVEAPPAPPPAQPGLPPEAIVPLDLAQLFDNDAISTKKNIKDANFDLPKLKSGSAYPADELPKPGPFAPEGPAAVTFRFPDYADGKPNNIACDSQRIAVPQGVYARLWLLAAAEMGNQEGTGRLVYKTGEEPFALRLTDWCEAAAFGEIEAVRCAHRHTWDGQREAEPCRIWAVAVGLREQPLQAVVLPRNKRMHVFAATLVHALETEAARVRAIERFFNNDGISWRANPKDGNFDLPGRRGGDTFIADLLPKAGADVAVPGRDDVTFRFPGKDNRRRNNVVCDGQRIHLPEAQQERWDAAWFLGACHDGAQRGTVTAQYEDGREGQGELRLANWCAKPKAGEIDVLRTPARHLEDGTEEKTDCGLVAWRVPLDPKRKLLSITLPRERRMHVFALTLTRMVESTSEAKDDKEP